MVPGLWQTSPSRHSLQLSLHASRYPPQVAEGPVAQRLEQGTHNPLVGGSNPSGPTTRFCSLEVQTVRHFCCQFFFFRTATTAKASPIRDKVAGSGTGTTVTAR